MSALENRVVQLPASETPKSEAMPERKFEVEPWQKFEPAPDDVIIHIRFHPNADVAWMGVEPPEHVSWKDLYTHLRMEAYDYYRGLAGGRGFFRIPRATYDAIVSKL
jgi:hypothetical protein